MKSRNTGKKFILLVLVVLLVIVGLWHKSIITNGILKNNEKLSKAIIATNKDEVVINDLVEFDWDSIYTFEPYTSKEDMKEIVGKGNNKYLETYSEGMTQLIFIKNKKIVCQICKYPEQLNYSFDFGEFEGSYIKINNNDHARFIVEKKEIVNLKYIK